MKKSEFKKMLKKENHPITQGKIYEIIFVVIFILLCATMLILQFKDILPSNIGLKLNIISIIIIIPYCVMDMQRDKQIKEMYEHYEKKNKILEVKDNSKNIKTMVIVEIVCTLILGLFIMTKYVFNNQSQSLKYKEPYTIELNSGEKVQLKEYTFDNDSFSLMTPVDFVMMDEETIIKKYPSSNHPNYVLTNENASINIAVSITKTPLKNSQIKSYLNLMEEEFKKIADVIDTRFFERNGHEVGEIKLITEAVDTDIYNHMMVFSENGYLGIVSFNCTKELQKDWQEVGEFIMNSIYFK